MHFDLIITIRSNSLADMLINKEINQHKSSAVLLVGIPPELPLADFRVHTNVSSNNYFVMTRMKFALCVLSINYFESRVQPTEFLEFSV